VQLLEAPGDYRPDDIEQVMSSYVETALWASCDEHDVPMDENYDAGDIMPASLDEARGEVADFLAANRDTIERVRAQHPNYGLSQVGHDFFLTRNRHGAGFWDHGLGEDGDTLSDAAKVYGSSNLEEYGEGRLYFV